MAVVIEFTKPFKARPRKTKLGRTTRLRWAWFSFTYFSGSFCSAEDLIREDEKHQCCMAIATVSLGLPLGDPKRGGMVLAHNILLHDIQHHGGEW